MHYTCTGNAKALDDVAKALVSDIGATAGYKQFVGSPHGDSAPAHLFRRLLMKGRLFHSVSTANCPSPSY